MSASDYMNANCTEPYYDPECEHNTHEGDYTELQVGPAPTQLHTFPIAPMETYEWTEFFKGFHANTSRVHSTVYRDAVDEVGEWLDSSAGVPEAQFDEIDAWLKSLASVAVEPENIIHHGMPWGGLREALNGGAPLVAGGACPFDAPSYNAETAPWLDLLKLGTFANATLQLTPTNFEVDAKWIKLIHASMEEHVASWLHHLFLGTFELEIGNAVAARASFLASIELRPSAHAYRALALFAPSADAASALFHSAWSEWELLDAALDPVSVRLGKDLAGEMAAWLMLQERWDELEAFLASATAYASKDRVLHARAALALERGNWSFSVELLTENCYPTYGTTRKQLIDLWFRAKVAEAVERKGGGKNLTTLATVHLRRHLGCDGDYSTTTILDGCNRGPPNLGVSFCCSLLISRAPSSWAVSILSITHPCPLYLHLFLIHIRLRTLRGKKTLT